MTLRKSAKVGHSLQRDTDMNSTDAAPPNRMMLYRAIGLILIGVGGFLAGAGGVPIDGWNNPFESLPFGIVVGVAVGVSFLGVSVNGLVGMVLFALACAVLGCVIVDGDMPMWLYPQGLPCLMTGIILRVFNRP